MTMRQPIRRKSETWKCGAKTTTSLNISMKKELIVDYIHINKAILERVESFKFLCPHHLWSIMVHTTTQSWRGLDNASTTPPPVDENIRHHLTDLQKCIQLHHWENLDWLHHCLVRQLLGIWPEDATEGSAYGPVHHWGQASCHPGPLYHAVSEVDPKNRQRLQPS